MYCTLRYCKHDNDNDSSNNNNNNNNNNNSIDDRQGTIKNASKLNSSPNQQ